MFKLIVLCAFVAVVAAEPEPQIFGASVLAPGIISPAARVLPASSYLYQTPLVSAPLAYSAPLGYTHLIKKRSAPLALSPYSIPSSYIVPGSYAYSSPLVSTYSAAAPLVPAVGSGLIYSSGAHFIKKRSAPLYSSAYIAPSSYIAPLSYSAPLVPSSYSAPILSSPLISSAPISYTHLIKKRSAPLAIAAYSAPGSYSHESRFDYKAVGPVTTTYTSYASPLSYSHPLVYPHLI